MGRYSDAATTDQAVLGVAALARHIEETSLSSGLFGWTSMFDLCIAQTAMSYPYAGPHLRVSPLSEGLIEFRYVDTAIAPKQWKRTVHATEAIARLHGFLAQLNWVARSR